MSFRYYQPDQVGGMLVYEGSRRQRGGNLLATLKRHLLPIGKSIAQRAARHAKKAGKDLAKRGVKVGVGAVTDRLRGGPSVSFKQALKQRATTAADKAIVDYLGEADQPDIPFLSQDGYGLRRKRKRKATPGPSAKRRRRAVPKRKAATIKGRRRKAKRKSINKMKARQPDIFNKRLR